MKQTANWKVKILVKQFLWGLYFYYLCRMINNVNNFSPNWIFQLFEMVKVMICKDNSSWKNIKFSSNIFKN